MMLNAPLLLEGNGKLLTYSAVTMDRDHGVEINAVMVCTSVIQLPYHTPTGGLGV